MSGMAGCDAVTAASLGLCDDTIRAAIDDCRASDLSLCMAVSTGSRRCFDRVVSHKRLLEGAEAHARETIELDEGAAFDSFLLRFAL